MLGYREQGIRNSHGTRPDRFITPVIQQIRISWLSIHTTVSRCEVGLVYGLWFRVWVWGPGLMVHGFGFRLQGFASRVWGLGSGCWSLGCQVPGSGFRVPGFGVRVSGFGFRVSVFGFRVSGLGFQVPGFGFRVSGFGFRSAGFQLKIHRASSCIQRLVSTPLGPYSSPMRRALLWP